mmetsp:Transcript_50999/g.150330  ORF Transcript_50999/g.150330 Transcript_50999/m.150330 type:complete len:235 (+) Transcript_50999:166-870(+)
MAAASDTSLAFGLPAAFCASSLRTWASFASSVASCVSVAACSSTTTAALMRFLMSLCWSSACWTSFFAPASDASAFAICFCAFSITVLIDLASFFMSSALCWAFAASFSSKRATRSRDAASDKSLALAPRLAFAASFLRALASLPSSEASFFSVAASSPTMTAAALSCLESASSDMSSAFSLARSLARRCAWGATLRPEVPVTARATRERIILLLVCILRIGMCKVVSLELSLA